MKPLSLVSGITPDVADRLEEEGITEITSLAMADPLRLVRNTSYDVKLIVAWMDEALLVYYAPAGYEALKKRNVTGAIDLASFALSWPKKADAKRGEWPGLDLSNPAVIEIAKAVGSTPEELGALVERVYEDAQVQLVWALFQLDESATAEPAEQRANGEAKPRELPPDIVNEIRAAFHEEMLEHFSPPPPPTAPNS